MQIEARIKPQQIKQVEIDLAKLAKASGTSIQWLANDQMRLWINDLIRLTPPETYAQGRKRVAVELDRLFVEMDSIEDLGWEISEGIDIASRVFRSRVTGSIYGVENALYEPHATTGEMRRHHDRYRTPKLGRVTTAGTFTRDIGRWKFVDKMHVGKRKLKEYTRYKQSHVGTLKAGWAKPAQHYAALTNGRNPALANWIRRNRLRAEGEWGGRMDRLGNGQISATNAVSYAKYKISDRTLALSRRKRAKDLARWARKRVDNQVRRANAKRSAA